MVSLHGGHAEDDESEKPTVVRIHRKKRYSKYRVLAPSPAFSAPTDFKKQHGVTLGRAPRPCLLPGPQPLFAAEVQRAVVDRIAPFFRELAGKAPALRARRLIGEMCVEDAQQQQRVKPMGPMHFSH